MPTPAYVTIEGTSQGLITADNFTADSVGNIWQEGHENEAIVQAFQHEVIIPRDPQSGQPTGQRVHQPVVLTKIFDKSSPLLYNALCNGEVLSKVEIKWWRTAMDGMQEHYFTHVLTDAVLVDIKAFMPNCQDPGQAHFTHLEELSMSYRRIEWTHEVAGTTGEDDWRTPNK